MNTTSIMKAAEVYSKNSLIESFERANQSIKDIFSSFDDREFFHRNGEEWSPSDRLEHLIKSVKPVDAAMRLPKASLRLLFGIPEKRSRKYNEIRETYHEKLRQGAQARGRYLPARKSDRQKLVEQWNHVGLKLIEIIKEWNEKDLDAYRLLHPLLGKLTIREMLFFTLYHNLHHTSERKQFKTSA